MTRRPSSPAATPLAVADRLHSAALHLLRRLRRHDEAMGITAARASALSVAVFAGPVTLGRLAKAEQVSAPTITRLVVAMEEEGLLKREPDPTDRRVVWIRPTAKGTRLLTAGRRRRVEAFARELSTLDQDSLSVLSRAAELLEQLGRSQAAPDHKATSAGPAKPTARRGKRRHI
ncbi:MAG: MarR family winged helix-turn-helix transcriptional regulator [Vicinamibacterales bacterium]